VARVVVRSGKSDERGEIGVMDFVHAARGRPNKETSQAIHPRGGYGSLSRRLQDKNGLLARMANLTIIRLRLSTFRA
jgi:hypothetical protein